jgi:hypothetical protein
VEFEKNAAFLGTRFETVFLCFRDRWSDSRDRNRDRDRARDRDRDRYRDESDRDRDRDRAGSSTRHSYNDDYSAKLQSHFDPNYSQPDFWQQAAQQV